MEAKKCFLKINKKIGTVTTVAKEYLLTVITVGKRTLRRLQKPWLIWNGTPLLATVYATVAIFIAHGLSPI